jgi:hypothetical protein
MTYAIAMGVRRGQTQLKAMVEQILIKEKPAIARILADYGVPDATPAQSADGGRRASPAARSD